MQKYDKPGQPSKLTLETSERLFYAIKLGAPYRIACDYAGISYATFRKWIIRADDAEKSESGLDTEYVEFLDSLKKAKGSASVKWLKVIDDSMDTGTWQAAAWKLERRNYEYFSAQTAILDLSEQIKNLTVKLGKDTSNVEDKSRCKSAISQDGAESKID